MSILIPLIYINNQTCGETNLWLLPICGLGSPQATRGVPYLMHVSSSRNISFSNTKYSFYIMMLITYFQDLFSLDLLKLEWSSFKDAGARPAPTSFHSAVQFGQFMITYGGRFNDNSHSDQLNVLGLSFLF